MDPRHHCRVLDMRVSKLLVLPALASMHSVHAWQCNGWNWYALTMPSPIGDHTDVTLHYDKPEWDGQVDSAVWTHKHLQFLHYADYPTTPDVYCIKLCEDGWVNIDGTSYTTGDIGLPIQVSIPVHYFGGSGKAEMEQCSFGEEAEFPTCLFEMSLQAVAQCTEYGKHTEWET